MNDQNNQSSIPHIKLVVQDDKKFFVIEKEHFDSYLRRAYFDGAKCERSHQTDGCFLDKQEFTQYLSRPLEQTYKSKHDEIFD